MNLKCEEIQYPDLCETSDEAGTPCEWDDAERKCIEFDFKCEKYRFEAECNAINFDNFACFWKNRCVEVMLRNESPEMNSGKQDLSLEEEEESKLIWNDINIFFVAISFGFSVTVTLCVLCICGGMRKQKASDLMEPLDLEKADDFNSEEVVDVL